MPGAVDTHTHLNAEPPEPPRPNGNTDDYVSGSSAGVGRRRDDALELHADARGRDAGGVRRRASRAPSTRPRWRTSSSTSTWGTTRRSSRWRSTTSWRNKGFVSTGEDFLARVCFDQNAVAWLKSFRDAGPAGVLSMLHAEDASIMAEAQERLMAEGKGSIHNFSQSAPAVAEVVAVQRAVAIAEATGTPMYILHTSSGRALQVAEDAMRRGLPVFVETRPMYLHLTAEVYQRPDAGLYLGGPPLRDKWDQDKLWEGIAKGTVHTIGTDHSGYSKAAKLDPTQTLANKRMGLANLQEYLPMMFSEGVVKERITLEQFAAVTSTNAAKLFGLYPRKGAHPRRLGRRHRDVGSEDEEADSRRGHVLEREVLHLRRLDGDRLAEDDDPPRRGGVRQRQDRREAGVRQVRSRRALRASGPSPFVNDQLTQPS